MSYVELQVTSNFSFLRGASHPEEMVEQSAACGYHAVAVTDRNTFAGIVRAHVAAKKSGIRFIPACRLDLMDANSVMIRHTNPPRLWAFSHYGKAWRQEMSALAKRAD